jgi:hypothetical protein
MPLVYLYCNIYTYMFRQESGHLQGGIFVTRIWCVNLHLNPSVTTIMSGHGNIRSYLHRLKIVVSPECPCKQDIQTVEHLIFQCERLKNERGMLKKSVLKVDNWAVSKSELINKNLKQFIRYINWMDLEKLNHSKGTNVNEHLYEICIFTLECSIFQPLSC